MKLHLFMKILRGNMVGIFALGLVIAFTACSSIEKEEAGRRAARRDNDIVDEIYRREKERDEKERERYKGSWVDQMVSDALFGGSSPEKPMPRDLTSEELRSIRK